MVRRGRPILMKTSPTKFAVALLAAGLIALTGCSSGDSDSSGDTSRNAVAADGLAAEDAPSEGDGEATLKTQSDSGSDAGGTRDNGGANRPAPATKAMINTGTVSLASPDTEKARFDLQKVVDSHGGTIAEEETSTEDDGTIRRSRVVVRVPAREFADAMKELKKVAELTGSSQGSEDVTTQVIDTEVRVRAQEKSLKRIELLLARAESIADIVSIEAQLTSRQAELDSLKSQQAYLEDQTSLSTITVHLEHQTAAAAKEKKDDEHNAFVGGLLDGWHALTGVGAGLATVVGALLPFAVVLGILGYPVLVLARRLRTRQQVAPQVANAE